MNSPESNKKKGNILLVDDDANVLHALSRLLRLQPYHIYTAENGVQALEILTENEIDVMVSDIQMPIMDGKELLVHVSDIYPDTVNIVLTNDASDESLIDIVNKSNIFNYISKPWDNTVLIEAIETAFKKSHCIKTHFLNCPKDLDKHIPAHASTKNYQPDSHINILIVDDEKAITNSLKAVFRNKRYQIYTANSGEEGLKLMADFPIDIIISDIRMPLMSGVEFLSIVETKFPDVQALVLSGYSNLTDMFEITQKPIVYHYMCKPWNNDNLIEQVKRASERLYINRKGLND